jgi:epoxyqueuosine reductase
LPITAADIRELAAECGFELAGVAAALPHEDYARFEDWRAQGFAGEMGYLTDRRGDLRADPRHLLPAAVSVICVGKLYNTGEPSGDSDASLGRISRYAWGADYHQIVRDGLEQLVQRLRQLHPLPFEHRICVDTAPLLERSYARAAGLGWIGKNTCLINQQSGSWFFLGELLISLNLDADSPPPDRCGSCTRCIDACPTDAIVRDEVRGDWTLDARQCISYLTIEKRGPLTRQESAQIGNYLFGCDICQDVCPWNRRAPVTEDGRFAPSIGNRELTAFASLEEAEFRTLFRHSPIWRAKYQGFLRNVAFAMSHSGQTRMAEPLRKLAEHPDPVVAEAAKAALDNLFERRVETAAH